MSRLRTEIKRHGDAPTIFVNDSPITGLMYWSRNLQTEDIRRFGESGVRLYSFLGNIDLGDPAGTLVQDGCRLCTIMTPEYIDSVMERVLAANPDALLIPRFRLQASDVWKESNPGCLMRWFDLETNQFTDGTMASLGLGPWIDDALEALARSVAYCEERWGEHIAGYHSGFGHCAEHVSWWGPVIADYHPAMRQQFRDWLRQRYGTESALGSAWKEPGLTFGTAEFPAPERFAKFTPSSAALMNPERDQPLIDMLRFHSEHMAGLVVRQARTVKDVLRARDSRKLFGAFYCYSNLPANSISHYAGGQDAHQPVLDCPDLDYISAPVGYSARQPGGVSTGQTQPGSVVLAGKLYFAEDDTGTHLTQTRHNTMAATAAQSCQMITRGFLDVWRSGGTQWFMDLFGEGEHRDPEIMGTIDRLAAFAGRHLEDRRSTAEIAVFFSDTSLSYAKTNNFLTGNLIKQQLNEIAAIGASADVFRIEDLPELVRQNRLAQYKFAIMLNVHVISDEVRALVETQLKTGQRTILWFHAPGLIHQGRFSPERSNELTGIHCVMQTGGRASLITEVLVDGRRFSYGTQRNVYPRLVAADPQATSLGYLVEGTWTPFREGSDGAMLAMREFPEFRSVWSGSPNMPSGLLAMFAEKAGVHLYCRCGSQVFHAANWVAVHAKWDGELELRFPDKVTLRDAFTGDTVAVDTDLVRRTVHRGDNLVFELEGSLRGSR